jgi:hypothetical protein
MPHHPHIHAPTITTTPTTPPAQPPPPPPPPSPPATSYQLPATSRPQAAADRQQDGNGLNEKRDDGKRESQKIQQNVVGFAPFRDLL